MMEDTLEALYKIILERREQPSENSYTCYLFREGLDKILKKVGEEASEVIIAAKNGNRTDTVNEISDLAYHILVLMAEQGITIEELSDVLGERRQKTGNLKQKHKSDKYS